MALARHEAIADTLLSYSARAHSIGRTPGQHTLELALRRADDRYLPAHVRFTLQNTIDGRCAWARSATTGLELR